MACEESLLHVKYVKRDLEETYVCEIGPTYEFKWENPHLSGKPRIKMEKPPFKWKNPNLNGKSSLE